MEDAAGPPTEIESGTATASREQGFIQLRRRRRRPAGRARAARRRRLQLNLSPDLVCGGAGGGDRRRGPHERRGRGAPRRAVRPGRRAAPAVPAAERGLPQQGRPPGGPGVNGASSRSCPGRARRRRSAASLRRSCGSSSTSRAGSRASGEPGRRPSEPRVPSVAVLTSEPVPPATTPARRVQSDRFVGDARPRDRGREARRRSRAASLFAEPGRRGSAPEGRLRRRAPASSRSRPASRACVDEAQGGELRGRRDPARHAIAAVSATRERAAHDDAAGGRRAARAARRRGADGHPVPAVRLRPAGEVGPLQGQRAAALGHGRDARAARSCSRSPRQGKRRLTASGRRARRRSAARGRRRPGEEAAGAGRSSRSREMVYDEARTGSSTPATWRSGRATS